MRKCKYCKKKSSDTKYICEQKGQLLNEMCVGDDTYQSHPCKYFKIKLWDRIVDFLDSM